jgi:putative transposase
VDFVHDSLIDGRRFRVLTTIDEFSRESLALELDVSFTGERVTRVLDRLCDTRGVPTVIQSDNGPEFTSQAMDQWAYDHGVRLQFIEPGKPIQNAFVESYMDPARAQATLLENPQNSVAVVYPACL